MREIMFRGKATGLGCWVHGKSIIHLADGGVKIIPKGSKLIDGAGHFKVNGGYEVDPVTVGQYTGLKDKNGVRIFESDIVDCWSEGVNARGTVQQRKDGMWIIYPAWQKAIMWSLCPDEHCNTTVEVIGNIHDNPELMEG